MSRELPGPYDPELPILAELERALRARERAAAEPDGHAAVADDARAARPRRRTDSTSYRGGGGRRRGAATGARGWGAGDGGAEGGGGADAAGTSRAGGTGVAGRGRRRRRGSHGAVVLRRTALLASLSLLVGATAVATRSFVGSEGHGDPSLRATPAVELGSGVVADERWSLSAARRGGEICHGFLVGGAVATRCARPPAVGEVVVDGLATTRARYVVGLAGAQVERVVVRRGAMRATTATRPLPTTTAARRAQVPRAVRWFVVALPPAAGRGPATVVAQGRGGAPLGPAVVACARGARERDCQPR